MSGRSLSPLLAILALLGASACRRPEGTVAPGSPVVLISIDTLRADRLPAYGHSAGQTPAIDRLAADGILFEHAWSHVPLTLPSHASLLTGELPPRHGVRSNLGFRLDPARGSTLPGALREAGYATGAAVSAYVLRAETGIAAGFDFYDDAVVYSSSATMSELERSGERTLVPALAWLEQVAARPFFLWVHLFEPHFPYEPPEPYRSRVADAYDGEVATADAAVGRLLAALDARGLYDRALIVLLSDHGEGLGDHGEQEHGILLYREALQVPLIVKLPGGVRAGERVKRAVGLVDVAPTVYEVLAVKPPATLDGRSLLVAGEAPEPRAIYGETLYPRIHLGWSELRTLVDDRWQYIAGPDPELYDLAADPRQRDNALERERREYRRLRDLLEAIPLGPTEAPVASAEERARLAALGYLASTAPVASGPRLDPKREIGTLEILKEAFRLANSGRLAEAETALRRLLVAQPGLVDARLQLAAVLRRTGRSREARDEYRKVAETSPAHVESVALEVAKVELDLGDLAAAAANARVALPASPAEAHLVLAAVALEQRDLRAAEREARMAVGDDARPHLPALVLLARVQVAAGELPAALATVERGRARLASGQAEPVEGLEAIRGDVLARLGRAAEAEAAFRAEVAGFPRTLEAYTRLAILLATQKRFDEIRPTLDAMVAAVPSPRAFLLAGEVMADLGNLEDAKVYRTRARQLGAVPES